MKYVGVDLHRDFFVAIAQDEYGSELLRKRYDNSTTSVADLVSQFETPPMVVVEATRNWEWFTQALQRSGCIVQLAHPFRTKAIASAKIKTDSIDAKTLCDLLRANLIPQSYIASPDILDNRELGRARISFVHDQTMLKNRIHAILIKENLRFTGTDLFGEKGKVWLEEQQLSPLKKEVIREYVLQLSSVGDRLKTIDALIKQRSSGIPEVTLLKSIPAIGLTTAFLLVSEIGDVKRFANRKKFASYFGMVPRLSQSGNHAYYGRITKVGNPYVRWLLVQAAHRLYRMDREYKKYVDRLSFRCGKKKAIVALARELATICFAVLRDKREYTQEKPEVCSVIIPE